MARMDKVLTGADALPDGVPIGAGGEQRQALRLQDVAQLLAHFAHLAHRLAVHEVLRAPLARVTARDSEFTLKFRSTIAFTLIKAVVRRKEIASSCTADNM